MSYNIISHPLDLIYIISTKLVIFIFTVILVIIWFTTIGLGNAVSALMGGFGGCGLIPNTVLNARAGGKGALSAIGYAVFLSLAVVTAAPAIGSIPLAALAGSP